MFDTDKVIVVADVTKQPYLSVARFSGGCRVNGVFYAYVPQRDILVREDWLKAYSAMDYDKFIAAVKPEPNRNYRLAGLVSTASVGN